MKCNSEEKILSSLNTIVSNWFSRFENSPGLIFSFAVAPETHMLQVNGIELCQISDIDVNNTCIDADELSIYTITGERYDILIEWPFDGPAKICLIEKIPSPIVLFSTL